MRPDTVIISNLNSEPALDCDALVIEQDTFMLLGVDPVLEEPVTDTKTLAHEIEQQEPLIPGDVVVTGKNPLKLTAIVYDIEQELVCKEEWIDITLNNVLNEIQQRKLSSLCTPMLGVKHGNITPHQFLGLLQKVRDKFSNDGLKLIKVIATDESQRAAYSEYNLELTPTKPELH